jgi:hypothetical protein
MGLTFALNLMVLLFGLDVVYHSRYFYVMCCECGDSDCYRCQHKNAQQEPIQVAGYFDSRKSTTRYCFFINNDV